MGGNKALLRIEGRPLVERQAELLRKRVADLLISANDPEVYEFLGLTVVPDQFPGMGPLAGLQAAMSYSHHDTFLLVACDMPAISVALLDVLIHCSDGFDATVPESGDGRPHPLCAIYRKTCLPVAERNLLQGTNKFLTLLEDASLRTRFLRPGNEGYHGEDLLNLNSPEDLSNYLRLAGPERA
jgi:molybdopterin-guanine dinucleotide biosynthesis protein A